MPKQKAGNCLAVFLTRTTTAVARLDRRPPYYPRKNPQMVAVFQATIQIRMTTVPHFQMVVDLHWTLLF
jgi:hypothetical protein